MRPFAFNDLCRFSYACQPALADDGRAAWCVYKVKEDGTFTPEIHRYEKGQTSLLPSAPALLPSFGDDGRLYFLLDEKKDGVYQLACFDNDVHVLTHMRHGISFYSLKKNKAVFSFLTYPEDPWEKDSDPFTLMSEEERSSWKQKKDRAPVEIDEIMYKFDETKGIPDGHVDEIGVLDLESKEVKILTSEPFDHSDPVLFDDGTMACSVRDQDGWKKTRARLAVYDSTGMHIISKDDYVLSGVPAVWMDDGTLIYGSYAFSQDGTMRGVFRRACPGKDPEDFRPEHPECFGPGCMAVGHTAYGNSDDTVIREDDMLYFTSFDQAKSYIYAMDCRDKTVKPVLGGACCIHDFAVKNGRFLYTKGEYDHIARIYLYEDGKETCLCDENAWMKDVSVSIPEEVRVPSSDGKAGIHGWIMKPLGFEEGKKYPAVLDIHGGPECCYCYDYWHEFQALAANGFAVLYCDPRGSVSYGDEYAKGAWDHTAYNDLLTFTGYAVSLGFIDDKKIGVTGGSYGGFMTNFIISHTDRFACAVSQRNLCNRVTSYGTGDMGSILEEPFLGCMHSFLSRLSGDSTTIKWIDNVHTPLLILHATNDYRCSFEQGEQLFIAMKQRHPDVPVKFCAFPGENHGLTRTGNTWAQIGHLKEMTEWFRRFLKEEQP